MRLHRRRPKHIFYRHPIIIKSAWQRYMFSPCKMHAVNSLVAFRFFAGLFCVVLAGVSSAVSANSFPAEFPLSRLALGDGTAGFVLNGVNLADRSGSSVNAAGDINGDGVDDIIIGAFFAAPGGRYHAGQSYVVFGRTTGFESAIELSNLASGDGSTGFVLNGTDVYDRAGWSVSGAGDINGDGIDDIIISSVRANSSLTEVLGESYVVFGRDTSFPAEIELSSLMSGDGSTGFMIDVDNGSDPTEYAPYSVSAAGDINGDGRDDLIIGAPFAAPDGQTRAGEVYVVFGRDTGFPARFEVSSLASGDGSIGFVLVGIDPLEQSGNEVSAAGDINNDGVDDLIIGAFNASSISNGPFLSGETFVVFGRTTGFPAEFELSSLASGDGSTGFVLKGIDQSDRSGSSVSAAGDINHDGIDDLIIGAPSADPGEPMFERSFAGESYVVFGRNTDFPAQFYLSSLASGDGSTGFVVNGAKSGDIAGISVSSAGDINGDGIDDIIIGASGADAEDKNAAGKSFIVYGRDSGFPAEFELSSLPLGDCNDGVTFIGVDPNDRAGRSVNSAGDINGDGMNDLIIGAPSASDIVVTGIEQAGKSYVVFGRAPDLENLPDTDCDSVSDLIDNCTLVVNIDQRDTDGDGYGNFCDPDLNNDGIVNFIDVALWTPFFNTPKGGNEDFNGDGNVNFLDYSQLLDFYLEPPGPSNVGIDE